MFARPLIFCRRPAHVLILAAASGLGACSRDLDVSIRLEPRDLASLADPVAPVVEIRNSSGRPLRLPDLRRPGDRFLRLVMYRPGSGPPGVEDLGGMQPPAAEQRILPGLGPPRAPDTGAGARTLAPVVALKPGQVMRVRLAERPAAAFARWGDADPHIGVWHLQALLVVDRQTPEGPVHDRAMRRNLWTGVVRSEPVPLFVQGRKAVP